WSYHNDYNPALRQKMTHVDLLKRFEQLNTEVELGFTAEQTVREVQRCLNCDVQTVLSAPLCIECDACIDVCPVQCLTITHNGTEQELRQRVLVPATNLDQTLFVSEALPQTGRVMLKDENLCAHRAGYGRVMSPGVTLARPATRVNDFAVKLANVNGTGSASANSLLMQAIFRMGVPGAGKNLFPSNIQGLPTWYEIRVNADGWTARAPEYDLMVAMNAQTYDQDIREVCKGGYVLYDSTWPLDAQLHRDDVTFLGVPLAQLCNEKFKTPRERILMKNIAYTGTLVALLGIDMELIAELLDEKYAGKARLRDSNHVALRLGYDHAIGNFDC